MERFERKLTAFRGAVCDLLGMIDEQSDEVKCTAIRMLCAVAQGEGEIDPPPPPDEPPPRPPEDPPEGGG